MFITVVHMLLLRYNSSHNFLVTFDNLYTHTHTAPETRPRELRPPPHQFLSSQKQVLKLPLFPFLPLPPNNQRWGTLRSPSLTNTDQLTLCYTLSACVFSPSVQLSYISSTITTHHIHPYTANLLHSLYSYRWVG